MSDAEKMRRAHAVEIFRSAVSSADPRRLVAKVLRKQDRMLEAVGGDGEIIRHALPVLVVGAGKGAAGMAAACEDLLGRDVSGAVIVSDEPKIRLQSIQSLIAGHPIPDARGVAASRFILRQVEHSPAPTLLALLTGGASSLLVAPRFPVTLADKILVTDALLRCGADISEINPVRKHLSDVKGGGLLRRSRRPTLTLMLSDVVGDDPSTIGSGPTVPDPTTFAEAWEILRRYQLVDNLPLTVRRLFEDGIAGKEAETLKPNAPEASREKHVVIGSNRLALEAAARTARTLGWAIELQKEPLRGDTAAVARQFASAILQRAATTENLCFLAGGETTVEVRGTGKGGRNQEFGLHCASGIAGREITLLSAGTDGIDGPTDAAGAFVDGTTLQRAATCGADPTQALFRNDSYRFFEELGDLYRCGATGTNVMDIKIALIGAPPASSGRNHAVGK